MINWKKVLLTFFITLNMLTMFSIMALADDRGAVGPGQADETIPVRQDEEIGPGVEKQPDPSEILGDVRNLEPAAPIVPILDQYSYDQLKQDIMLLSSTYGTLMQVNVIGKSLDNRDIYEIVVGNPDAGRHIVIQAGIHAREHMTALLVMKQMELALYTYRTGSYNGRPISDMLNQVAIHFVPMSNPDGITLSQFGLDGIQSEELRNQIQYLYELNKSIGVISMDLNTYLTRWKANARGVDLNNNFPAGWELIPTLSHPSNAGYKGEQPLSEPESQALANLAAQRSWAATISYHSMGQLVYWDYPVNHQRESSRHLANLVAGATGYRPSLSPNSHGGFKDFMQCSENSAPSVTLEIGMGVCPLPISDYPAIWAQNKSVWAIALEFSQPPQ